MSAPRWVRALARPGRVLRSLQGGGLGVFPGADRRRRPLVRVTARQVEAALQAGWVETAEGQYRLSASGHEVVGAGATHEAAGRGALRQGFVMDQDGRERRVTINPDEGAIAKWRAVLSPSACAAAEQFLSDYTRSSLHQSVTRNWSPTAPRRGEAAFRGPDGAAVSALAAKDRVFNALDALGPQFARIIEAALIREESLAAMERRFGWARRSGRTGVELAFARLAQIYGYAPD